MLGFEAGFGVLELEGVELDPVFGVSDGVLLLLDLDFQLGLSLDEASVFVGQVSGELSPVSGLSLFNFLSARRDSVQSWRSSRRRVVV